MTYRRFQLARLIDHTLLKPEATPADFAAVAAEAADLGTYSVCVSPSALPLASKVRITTVVGFPSGAVRTAVKTAEAAQAVADGADEIDMVIAIGAAKAHDWAQVEADIRAVRAVTPKLVLLKVIIESAVLTDDEIVACCQAAERAGANYVKTSTGFHPAGGATPQAVALMAQTVGSRLGVKASGGIRNLEQAMAMVEAGATRLGLSASRAILAELPE